MITAPKGLLLSQWLANNNSINGGKIRVKNNAGTFLMVLKNKILKYKKERFTI